MIDEIDQHELGSTEEAFRRAQDGYEWRGKPLPNAWSQLREWAARRMGVTLGMVADPDKMMETMQRDVAVILWLCHQDREVCKAARRNPDKFEDAVADWADEEKVSFMDAETQQVCISMIGDYISTMAGVKVKESAQGESNGGEAKNESAPPKVL